MYSINSKHPLPTVKGQRPDTALPKHKRLQTEASNEPYKVNYLGSQRLGSKRSLHRKNKYSCRSDKLESEKHVISFVPYSNTPDRSSILNAGPSITQDNYATEATLRNTNYTLKEALSKTKQLM